MMFIVIILLFIVNREKSLFVGAPAKRKDTLFCVMMFIAIIARD